MSPENENLEPAQTVELTATEGQQVDLANLLLTRVSKALRDMRGDDSETEPVKYNLAKLSWKESSYQLSFQASKDKKYNINLTGTNLDKTYVVTILEISPISKNDRAWLLIKLKFLETSSGVTFQPSFKIFENLDDEGSQLDNICVIRVRDSPDVSFLAKDWFPSEGQQSNKILPENYVKAFWPRFVSDQNIWQVSVPELTEEGTSVHEGEKWVWFFASLAAQKIILKNAYINNFPEFPHYKDFIPKRPIDLKTNVVQQRLEEKNVYIPWHIIETACSSLNAKKHVIFTGPPGCGKTTLAKMLAEAAGINHPIIATASPNWSSDELIGRYLPDTEGKGIKFSEGFFLKAIYEDKWLIIDELNRAEIDSCFGELFTVLSGQPVMLPFETYDDESNGESDSRKTKPIAVYPEGTGEQHSKATDTVAYSIQSKFRMIGTMNDADASRLNQLSYAFQRRFNIIRIEAPSTDKVKKLIGKRLSSKIKGLDETSRAIYSNLIKNNNIIFATAQSTLHMLFANQNNTDLIKQRVVGVAQILDVIDFIIEGLSTDGSQTLVAEQANVQTFGRPTVQSYIALALTMSVFPQLMALTGYDQNEELYEALNCILNAFGGSYFYRIEGKEERQWKWKVVSEGKLIKSFLKEELRRLFRHVQLQQNIIDLIEEAQTETVQS